MLINLLLCALVTYALVEIVERSRWPLHFFYSRCGEWLLPGVHAAVTMLYPDQHRLTLARFHEALAMQTASDWEHYIVEWYQCTTCHTIGLALPPTLCLLLLGEIDFTMTLGVWFGAAGLVLLANRIVNALPIMPEDEDELREERENPDDEPESRTP